MLSTMTPTASAGIGRVVAPPTGAGSEVRGAAMTSAPGEGGWTATVPAPGAGAEVGSPGETWTELGGRTGEPTPGPPWVPTPAPIGVSLVGGWTAPGGCVVVVGWSAPGCVRTADRGADDGDEMPGVTSPGATGATMPPGATTGPPEGGAGTPPDVAGPVRRD